MGAWRYGGDPMTLQPDLVEVACVRCGTVCTAYLKPAVDHEPERWCAEGMER